MRGRSLWRTLAFLLATGITSECLLVLLLALHCIRRTHKSSEIFSFNFPSYKLVIKSSLVFRNSLHNKPRSKTQCSKENSARCQASCLVQYVSHKVDIEKSYQLPSSENRLLILCFVQSIKQVFALFVLVQYSVLRLFTFLRSSCARVNLFILQCFL